MQDGGIDENAIQNIGLYGQYLQLLIGFIATDGSHWSELCFEFSTARNYGIFYRTSSNFRFREGSQSIFFQF